MDPQRIAELAQAMTVELGRPVDATPDAVAAALNEFAQKITEQFAAMQSAQMQDKPDEMMKANIDSIKSALGLEADASETDVKNKVNGLMLAVKQAQRAALASAVKSVETEAKTAPKVFQRAAADKEETEQPVSKSASRRRSGNDPYWSLKGLSDAVGYMLIGDRSALKSLGYTIGNNGGWLPNREVSDELIELFYANTVALKLGATRVNMGGAESLTYRKMKTGATARWGAMGQTVTASDPTFGVVNLNLRELVAETNISQRLIKNSSMNVEQMVRNDLMKAMELAADYAFLMGTGSKTGSNSGFEPLGLLNNPNVTKTTIATNGKVPTPKDFIDRWGAIEDANVPASDSWGFACSPRTKRTVLNTTDTTGQLIPQERFTQGYNMEVTTQILNTYSTGTASDTTDVYFGAWEYMIIGVGQDVEIVADESVNRREREVLIQAVMYVDMAVSHPEAFQVLRGVRA